MSRPLTGSASKRFYVTVLVLLGAVLLLVAASSLITALAYSTFQKSLTIRLFLIATPWLTFTVAAVFAFISIRMVHSIAHIVDDLRAIAGAKDYSYKVDMSLDDNLKELSSEINHLLSAIKQKEQQVDSMKILLEQKEQEDQLLWLQIEHNLCLAKEEAERDVLTGLYNRKAVENKFDTEIKRISRSGGSLSVLMADLDHFKRINDTYGHQVGDDVLKLFADIVKSSTRASDVAARYGGEEFIILLPDTSAEDAVKVARRLGLKFSQAVEREFATHKGLKCTVSIGVADFPKCAKEKDVLVANADAALFAAKERGRNCVVYYGDIRKAKNRTA
ncbi:MAG: GGDEF domain-containing protein [Firmicutes bacterium]|nr:GGDEF domain-containing protein [Bacillota bacterium]